MNVPRSYDEAGQRGEPSPPHHRLIAVALAVAVLVTVVVVTRSAESIAVAVPPLLLLLHWLDRIFGDMGGGTAGPSV